MINLLLNIDAIDAAALELELVRLSCEVHRIGVIPVGQSPIGFDSSLGCRSCGVLTNNPDYIPLSS